MRNLRKIFGRGGLYTMIGGFAFFGAFPFYWMVIATFKRDHDLFRPENNPFIFNEPPTLDHLRLLCSIPTFSNTFGIPLGGRPW